MPLAIVGSQVAHAIDYRVVAPASDERASLLAESGHGYLAYAPLALALCTVVVALALVAEARRSREGSALQFVAWHFALVVPLVFICQEHFERLAHDGAFPWDLVVQPTFVLGVVLQAPFAVVAFGLAWLLLRAARVMGRLFAAPTRARRIPSLVRSPVARIDAARLPVLALGFGTRGPPLTQAA